MFRGTEIDLYKELEFIQRENNLKKKLEKDIDISTMNEFDAKRKKERIETVFPQIRNLLRVGDLRGLQDYIDKNSANDKLLIKDFDGKINYREKILVKRGQLENSKDRMEYLSQLITKQRAGYDPIKNFMESYRIKSKIIEERKKHERELRLQVLKNREVKKLAAKKMREEKLRKKLLAAHPNKNANVEKKKLGESLGKLSAITINNTHVVNEKSERENLIEKYKPQPIEFNTDINPGMYTLPEFNRAIVFKFLTNFGPSSELLKRNKVIDLIDDDGDLLLHLNFRDGKIIMNSHIDNCWGKEETIVKEIHGDNVSLKILSKNDYFKILYDEKIIGFFVHRKNSKIKYINLNEEIRNFAHKVM